MLADREIILGCKEGKEKAYKALVDQYAPRLMATALRYLPDHASAEDAVQESLIRVFQSIHKYDHQDQLLPWLRKNYSQPMPQSVKKKVIWLHNDDIVETAASIEMGELHQLEDNMTMALLQLPEAYRLVFNPQCCRRLCPCRNCRNVGHYRIFEQGLPHTGKGNLKNYLLKCNNTGYVSGIS